MDVKTAFLHGSIKEEVYVEQPKGFEVQNHQTHVCRLKKALYGLKQAPHVWYERIDNYLMTLVFTKGEADPNIYFKVENDRPLILVSYVDDLFLTGADPFIHYNAVTTLMELNSKKLCESATGPNLGNPSEYRQLVGALMFLVNSRPDICFAVNTLSQFMVELHYIYWIGAKNLSRYLRGTITYGLRYNARNLRLHGYSDVDWTGSVVDRKSTSRCCFSRGSVSISWMSRKQKSVALSSTEAEYIAASMASCEAVWLRKLFSELFGHVLDTTVIYCDNQSGIHLSENLVFNGHSKHIDIRYHFIRDMVQCRAIRLYHIGTNVLKLRLG
eukprot:PITA_25171